MPAPITGMTASIIRTVVPGLVLAAAAGLSRVGIVFPNELLTDIVATLVGATVTATYYWAVRVMEHFASSKWGWLLGYPSAPTYGPPPGKHATERQAPQ